MKQFGCIRYVVTKSAIIATTYLVEYITTRKFYFGDAAECSILAIGGFFSLATS